MSESLSVYGTKHSDEQSPQRSARSEIDISRLEEALAAGLTIGRSTFTRVKPKSISMDVPPLLLRLPGVTGTAGGTETPLSVIARIYDIGAVGICFILEDMEATAGELREAALRFAGHEGLDQAFAVTLDRVREILSPLLQRFSSML